MTETTPKLDLKYILYVGSINPRKNIDALINAFLNANIKGLKLILVGKENAIYNSKTLNPSSNIVLKSSVNDLELQALYKGAELLVMPSFYEGFGLPIIEALYFGCPVICSDIPVFKELFADFVVYCNPNSVLDIEERLKSTLSMPAKQQNIDQLISKYSYANGAKTIQTILESDL